MSSSRFAEIGDKFSFSGEEEKTLQHWENIKAFETSLKLSEGRPEYTFYDGPPFATGLPHYGHLLAGTIKDSVTRYAHQTGHFVSRRFGWDCHGLPVEYEIDKKLNITGRDMVLEMGVDKYNAECRGIVQRYTAEWRKQVTRLGRWIDFDNDYKTMDPAFMESVWWVFKTMFEKDLVYRGYKVMPYSCPCGTPLSNFEAGLNYKDVNDPAAVITFPLTSDESVSFLAWTTTPWTLPSNLALCVNANFDYVKIRDKTRNNQVFIILEKRLAQLFPEVNKADCTEERKTELYDVLERMKGSNLVGLTYKPLFPYFQAQYGAAAFRVVSDDYVTEEGGTGIVHQAPAFGEDDYRVCLANGIIAKGEDLPCPVDHNGFFTKEVTEFAGRAVKEADNDICALLKSHHRLVMKEVYNHPYPFCWRSDTPLIYKAVPSWFVKVETLREKLLENNAKTYWVPAFVKEKRFHNWLADAKDWAISRNRFWGTPIPLWISDDLEEIVVVGSVEELYELSGVRVSDLHKDFVDQIQIPSKRGKGMLKRIEEVFDCWFESGSMPYAQLHYPFENKERFEKNFPADFIAEGIDQTRGWFYTLMVISTCLFDKPAFKNLIVNGLVLAADGRKMSKRLKNYPDPQHVVGTYGADAMRLYLINSPVVRADTLKFQEEGVSEVLRGVMIPWYQTFRFFAQALDRWESETHKSFVADASVAKSSENDVDVWILAAAQSLVSFVHTEMQAYRLYTVVPRLISFIDELSKWYVRLNRFRMKGDQGEEEAFLSLQVLFEVLKTMTVIMAPFTPFFTEFLYQHLRKLVLVDDSMAIDAFGKADSVHFVLLPQPDSSFVNPLAVSRFATLQEAVTLARMARDKRRIRTNLPLKDVIVVVAKQEDAEALQYLQSYFLAETNAWSYQISTDYERLCSLKITPNFAVFGKKVGNKNKEIVKQINEMSKADIVQFMQTKELNLCGFNLKLDEDLLVKREFQGDNKRYEACANDAGTVLVAIDTTADEELFSELRARSIVAVVQKLRKSAGLQVSDKVEMYYDVTGCKDAQETESMLECVAQSLTRHQEMFVKRLRQVPRLASVHMNPAYHVELGRETVKEADIVAKGSFVLILVKPALSVSRAALQSLVASTPATAASSVPTEQWVKALEAYLYSVRVQRLLASAEHVVHLEDVRFTFQQGVHYAASPALSE
jgi:isoleucyl-tRNA synthetase